MGPQTLANREQGRWHDGAPQFRYKIATAPADGRYGWYWYVDMDKDTYHDHLIHFRKIHYKLVSSDVYTWPDGSLHYNAIWQQVFQK